MPDPQTLPEQVFKFVSYRPPQRASQDVLRTHFMAEPGGRATDFRLALAELDGTEGASARAIALATAFIASGAYVANPDSALRDLSPYAALARTIAAAAAAETPEAEVLGVLEQHLGMPVRQYVQQADFMAREDRLWDSLYATSIARRLRPHDRDEVLGALRINHLLHAIAGLPAGADRLPAPLQQYLTATPLLPERVLPRTAAVPPREPPEVPIPPERELEQRLRGVQSAIMELRAALNDHQAKLLREADASAAAPAAPILSARGRSSWLWPFSRGDRAPTTPPKQSPSTRPSLARLPPDSVAALSPATTQLVHSLGASFELVTVPEVIEQLEGSARQAIASYVASTPRRQAYRLGSGFVRTGLGPPWGLAPGVRPPVTGAAPQGRIRSKGIADLLIVQQTLLRYEPGEVAHIENVMRTESRKRSHRRLSRTEQELVQEIESTKDSERDLQTTERFEMQRETETTQQLDASVKAGVTVAASYGPVETTAYADFALQFSRTESTRTATNYARDVSERSVARIMEREREQRTRRTIEEFEEINRHGFENVAADSQHISGIYRWIDKIYDAQIINYGRRLMLEFIVPEPAAFYRHAERHRTIEGVTLDPPEAPMVLENIPGVGLEARELQSPGQLDRVNYIWPVGQYNVAGVALPPAERTVVATALEQAAATGPVAKATSELKVPPGHVAATAEFHGWYYTTSGANMYTQIGNFWTYNTDGVTGLNWEDQLVPLSVLTEATPWVMNVEIVCQLTPEAFAAWQVDTLNAIMTAFRERESAYREQLAAAMIRQGVAIVGRNPARNREIEREEIKKACIRIMSGTDFSEFDAMQPGGDRMEYPEFDVAESSAEGRQIQFFEHAFEWDQLTYLFYPYFWSNRGGWLDVHQLDDVDPLFSRFLQAGSARVLVPVRPPFNDVVLNYLSTEQPPEDPWNGGAAPIINDPLYISLAAELREATGGRTAGDPVDEPWQIKVPTSLVILQADAVLPDFTTANS